MTTATQPTLTKVYHHHHHPRQTESRSAAVRPRPPGREWRAALVLAEQQHWLTTGGDFLVSHKPAGGLILSSPVRAGQQSSIRRLLLTAAVVVFLAGSPGSKAGSPAAPDLPPEVPVRRVTGQLVPRKFEFTGHTAASHQVEVRARVGGYLVQVPYQEGEHVRAGSVLFELDPRPFVAAHNQADALVARAEAAEKLARQEWERATRLAADEAIATEELERRATDVQLATAALGAAIAGRETAVLELEFTKVTAPIGGRIGRALVRPGNIVSGGSAEGTLLTTLVATSPLHVRFHVDEPAFRELVRLQRSGRLVRAEVSLGADAPRVTATLDYLAPFADVRSGTAEARLVVANEDGSLTPGLFARVYLFVDADEPRLLVPETAIGALQGSRYVLVVDPDNKVVHRPVVLGERRGNDRVVTSGLVPGESIVVNGLQRIRPGMTVQPVEAALAAN